LVSNVPANGSAGSCPWWSRVNCFTRPPSLGHQSGRHRQRTKANLIHPQRTAALRVIQAYRTVSDEATLILANMPPVDLIGLGRSSIKDRLEAARQSGEPRQSKADIKRQERRVTIDLWQKRWDVTKKGARTRRAIPSVRRWIERTVLIVPLSFHMTQVLSNHGCFEQYLSRMAKAVNAACCNCPARNDSAEHTIFACPNWSSLRVELAVPTLVTSLPQTTYLT